MKKTERGEGRVGERESRGEVGGEQKRRRKEGSEYFWLMLQMRNSLERQARAEQGKYSDSPDPKVDSSYLMQIRDSLVI